MANRSRTCTANCKSRPIDVFLSSFFYTAEERDTVIIREYTGDGSFSTLIREYVDTTGNNSIISNLSSDTFGNLLPISIYGDSSDFEIEIPGAGQTYRISEVVPTTKTSQYECTGSGHYQCSYPVKDYQISGGQSSTMIYDGFSWYHYTIRLEH